MLTTEFSVRVSMMNQPSRQNSTKKNGKREVKTTLTTGMLHYVSTVTGLVPVMSELVQVADSATVSNTLLGCVPASVAPATQFHKATQTANFHM